MKWTFTRPTQREDGTPLPLGEIDYYIATVDQYEYILPATATEVDASLPDGTWCCSIICIDTDGQPSVISNNVCQTQVTPKAPPNPPVIDNTDTVFFQDFEGVRTNQDDLILSDDQISELFNSPNYITNASTPGVSIVSDPSGDNRGDVLRVFFKQGTQAWGADWNTPLPPSDEYYFSYDLYVPAGFNWPLVTKIPGMYGGNLAAAVGGNIPDGTNGMSFRQNIESERKPGDSTGYNDIGDGVFMGNATGMEPGYAEKRQRYSYDLNAGFTDTSQAARLIPGQWMTVTQRIKLNTPSSSDGIQEAWLDGIPCKLKTDWEWRSVDTLKIDGVSFNWYYGGSGIDYNAREDQSWYFDNFKVSLAT